MTEAHEFLFSLGNPKVIRSACRATRVGKLLPDDFYVHRSAEDDLPPIIRLLTFAARQIVGDLSYEILKIRLDGHAVSFLTYSDFDHDPHPELLRAVRVYLPKAAYSVRDYRGHASSPILHRKETLVRDDYPLFRNFQALTEQEQAAGLLSSPDIGFKRAWESLLKSRGIQVVGHQLVSQVD
jgi:DNA phosphorothioation-associated putative methyltransferase